MNEQLSVLHIVESTVVDGPGFRTSIYAAGCANACPGCHNPQSWDIQNGTMMLVEEVLEIIRRNEFEDVTFSGGDPFYQVEAFTQLAWRIKEETDKNIWCYTGYTFEMLQHSSRCAQLLPLIDVLVDGRFVEALRDESLLFRGSSNQRIIDVPASLRSGQVEELQYTPYPQMAWVV